MLHCKFSGDYNSERIFKIDQHLKVHRPPKSADETISACKNEERYSISSFIY